MIKTFTIAAAALSLVATPAIASDIPSASVDISDLDLSDRADQLRLDQRIESTARRICQNDARDAAARRLERQCRAAVSENAAPQVELAIARARTERFASIELIPGA